MRNDVELLDWYESQNPRCELFYLFWREQPELLRSLWPGRLFPEADRHLSTETHHLWHPGNRPDLLSNLIRLSKPIHDWCHSGDPILGRVICSWKKLVKEETDIAEVRAASGYYLDGWLDMQKVRNRCRQAGRWWLEKRSAAARMSRGLRSRAAPNCHHRVGVPEHCGRNRQDDN